MYQIIACTKHHIDKLSFIFDLYRQFYAQSSDTTAAKNYLQQRVENGESIIFIAEENNKILGFVQLYPTFSSISMQRSLILNDLFVLDEHRRRGIAEALMEAAYDYGNEIHAKGLELSTQITNTHAQRLYEKLGYERDQAFFHYYLSI